MFCIKQEILKSFFQGKRNILWMCPAIGKIFVLIYFMFQGIWISFNSLYVENSTVFINIFTYLYFKETLFEETHPLDNNVKTTIVKYISFNI